jgi:hypothetical protein
VSGVRCRAIALDYGGYAVTFPVSQLSLLLARVGRTGASGPGTPALAEYR